MLKAKIDLEKHLEKEILKIVTNKETMDKVCQYAEHTYSIPYGTTMDYLTLRSPLLEANEFILFCIMDSIENSTKTADSIKFSKLSKYYTESEIKTYSTSKFEISKIKFPLKFKAVQIANDQWLSKIDFKTLMKLRAAQLINYNENTQRTMERIVRGETEFYRIDIDKDTVNAIEESYLNGTYIPTPFTFNISEESNADFYYNEERNELFIRSLDRFDISDGYHRYIAACKACDSNKSFNFTMELRITNFPDYKARHFIYQEDQKVKMSKTDSATYNLNSLANQIVEKLNSSPRSNIKGMISRNNGLIKYSDIAGLIEFYYMKEKTKNNNQLLVSIFNELVENFNMLTEANEKYLIMKYDFKKMMIIIHCFKHFENKSKKNMCEVIDEVIKKSTRLNPVLFSQRKPRKGLASEIQKILEEVVDYV